MNATALDMTRRWTVMMAAASLLLGSCSNNATTDDADATATGDVEVTAAAVARQSGQPLASRLVP
jgi:hypothetical protein